MVYATLLTIAAASPIAQASNHLVQIDEALAGANGNSRVQFVEIKMCCPGQNLWGPQSGESTGRARLTFFDASGASTGQFIFPSNPPDHDSGGVPDTNNTVSVLIATQEFAALPGMPTSDFIMPSNLLVAGGGQVCFTGNPGNPNAFAVNLCLSYGNFVGDTGQDLDNPPNPAGPPASALTITGAASLKRFQNFNFFETHQFNADFQLSTPAPRNAAGQTGTMSVLPQMQQGQTLFFQESFLGNGRTCGTCHLPRDRFGLSPTTMGLLPDNDPLFVAEFKPALAALENMCLVRSTRGVIEEHIDGFDHPFVYRGSPHLLNIALTAPYGLSGEHANLQTFSAGAVHEHFPRTLARNSNPLAGPLDFREPTNDELAALEAFMNSIKLPADGNYDLDRMINAAIARGGDAAAISRGRGFFTSPGQCFRCHGGPVLADVDQSMIDQNLVIVPPGGSRNLKFNTGVVRQAINNSPEINSCLDTALPSEAGGNREFSVAPLVGVPRTGPFFHDNSAMTLRDAVAFYNGPEFNQSPAAVLIGGISLSESQIDDITAFLKALDDPDLLIGPANGLTIGPIHPQSLGAPFDVVVSTVDDNNSLSNVTQNTNIVLSLRTGTGVLGGVLTGTILAGTHTVTIPAITYDTVEKGVGLRVTRTSGQMLSAANSNQFNFCPPLPTLQITSPIGGEMLLASGIHTITWNSTDAVGSASISLLKNGQVVSELGSLPASTGSFEWNICRYVGDGNDYKIRITLCHCAGCTISESSAPFTITNSITAPAFTITGPNGGESWTAGTTQTIQWTTTNPTGSVTLELLKNGQHIQGIASVPMALGSYPWSICEFIGDGSDYRVRISQCDCPTCLQDDSDADFSITGSSPPPSVTLALTSPNGGETLNVSTHHTITWTSTNPSGIVSIDLLRGGNFSSAIGSAPMTMGQFDWSICSSVADGADYTIRLTRCSCAGCIQDFSDAPFTITGSSGGALLTLTAPNGGEVWSAGSPHTITWSAPLASPSAMLDLFLFQGSNFSPIGSVPASAGSFVWTPCPFIGNATDCFVLARYIDDSCGQIIQDSSDDLFIINGSVTVPTLTLTSPNGGQIYQAGSTHTITWSSTSPAGTVNIMLVRDSQGGSGTQIGSALMSAGQIDWTLCAFLAAANDYRIRLQVDCGATSLTADSGATFTITQPAITGAGQADFNTDCHIDEADLAILAACRSAPGLPHNGTSQCQLADLDQDGDVDQSDFGLFQRRYLNPQP